MMPDPENIDSTPQAAATAAEPPAVEDEASTAVDDDLAPEWAVWQYNGPPGRMYLHIPVTVYPGDRLWWHSQPTDDGSWSLTDEEPTIHPDNYQPEPAPAVDADLKEPGTDG